MKQKFVDIFLYISSFIPLYFLIIVKELIEIANDNLTFNITNTVMLSLNLFLIVLGIIGVVAIKKQEYKKIQIASVKNITQGDFLPYFPLFVLFALAFELEFISMAVVYVLILVMVGIVYVKNKMFYINPFLNIIGFSTFEVTGVFEGKTVTKKLFSRKQERDFSYANSLFII